MWDEKDQRNARKAFKKNEKKLIQEVREGKHDDFIDLPFITRKCLESGLVEVGDNQSLIGKTDHTTISVSKEGEEFVHSYIQIIEEDKKTGKYNVWDSYQANVLMRHTYIFLLEGLNCPCCANELDKYALWNTRDGKRAWDLHK
jgi:hypothetical protein